MAEEELPSIIGTQQGGGPLSFVEALRDERVHVRGVAGNGALRHGTLLAQIPLGDPGIVSVGHEVDILKAAEYFPNDIIMGNLEPAIIQTATPQQVYDASREIIEKGKQCPGGFAFSPGCELPPMSPPLNVWMMTKAADDFGWYE